MVAIDIGILPLSAGVVLYEIKLCMEGIHVKAKGEKETLRKETKNQDMPLNTIKV